MIIEVMPVQNSFLILDATQVWERGEARGGGGRRGGEGERSDRMLP